MKHRTKPRPAQQPIYTFQVEALSHEGRGIAHYGTHPDHPSDKQGKKVFISYALPGETVKAQITNVVKRLEEADSIVLQPVLNRNVHILPCVAAVICSTFSKMSKFA